ncbi:MAG: SUF system NifU family Fe-S cluster assembly protein [Candidatus Obscuribacterales bacterium]|nr:SUF system NifU family Fe-S cluster assembly protein [Candidatus Obscuribacterales bacterium]
MSLADDLYRETILDHYHQPRNQGVLEGPSVLTVEGVNPLCGDELTLYLDVKDGLIADVAIKSHGCSINTASASMMTESVKGQPLAKVQTLIDTFKKMMMEKDSQVTLPEEMEELEVLEGVKKYPVRIKCALLPWNTLLEGLQCSATGAGQAKPKVVTSE